MSAAAHHEADPAVSIVEARILGGDIAVERGNPEGGSRLGRALSEPDRIVLLVQNEARAIATSCGWCASPISPVNR